MLQKRRKAKQGERVTTRADGSDNLSCGMYKGVGVRGYSVEVIIDAWCILEDPEEVMLQDWGELGPISLRWGPLQGRGKPGSILAALRAHEDTCGRAGTIMITRPDICMQPRCMDTIPLGDDSEKIGVIHRTGIENDLVCDHLITVPHSRFGQWLQHLEGEDRSGNFTRSVSLHFIGQVFGWEQVQVLESTVCSCDTSSQEHPGYFLAGRRIGALNENDVKWPPRWQPSGTEGIFDRKKTFWAIAKINADAIGWVPPLNTRRDQGMERILEDREEGIDPDRANSQFKDEEERLRSSGKQKISTTYQCW